MVSSWKSVMWTCLLDDLHIPATYRQIFMQFKVQNQFQDYLFVFPSLQSCYPWKLFCTEVLVFFLSNEKRKLINIFSGSGMWGAICTCVLIFQNQAGFYFSFFFFVRRKNNCRGKWYKKDLIICLHHSWSLFIA